MADPLVRVESLSYSYPSGGREGGRQALSDISLEIAAGERVVLLGPSGSGKSTLIQSFIGLIPHSRTGRMEGRVTVSGQDTRETSVPVLSRTVGFVFQDPDHQQITNEVDSELAYGLEQMGLQTGEIEERLTRVTAMLGMEHLRGRELPDLSWGERQKVAIASVLVMHPKMIVLDEPLSGLDADSAARLLDHLETVNTTWNIAVVIIEHRLDLLHGFMDRVIVMDAGRMVYDGPVAGYRPAEDSGACPPDTGPAFSPASSVPSPSFSVSSSASPPAGAPLPAPASAPTVEVCDVTFTYPCGKRPALEGVSAAFYPGEIVFICGPNGSGKSTFIKHLNGLLRPDCGRVLVQGSDIAEKTVAQTAKQVALVGQHADYQLFEETIERELAFGPRNLGMEDRVIEASITAVMEQMDMLHLGRTARPLKLSMGEKQRVTIASHLVMQTPVVVLDEPTLGLDCALKGRLASLLCDLKGMGKTVIVVTHDREFSRLCADRFLFFEDGRCVS